MIGEIVSHYKVLKRIGDGGMGEVYLAADTELERQVALKFLYPTSGVGEEWRGGLLHEARSASRLNHPNVVTIYAFESHDGRQFIAMEYVEGRTLECMLQERKLDVTEALQIAEQIADALACAHNQSVIHRDLKPSNVIIRSDGQVKLTDFGLARLIGQSLAEPADRIIGTLAYMSPEQIQGTPVDARSDVFTLGVLIYEMVAGIRPFRGDSAPAQMYATVYEDCLPLGELLPNISPAFDALVAKALSKTANNRFADGADILSAIRTAKGQAVGHVPSRPAEKAPPEELPSLAVLYIRNLGDAADEFLSYGITEDLIVDLIRDWKIRVTPMRTILRYKDANAPLGEIAESLGVAKVLDGSLHRSGAQIRLSAQMIDVQQEKCIWAWRWEGSPEKLPDIKREMAASVAKALDVDAAPGAAAPIQVAEDSTLAYERFLQGRYLFDHKKSADDVRQALSMFQSALSSDPSLRAARAGLADVHLHLGDPVRALKEAQFGIDQARQADHRPDIAAFLTIQARAKVQLDQFDDAFECASEAVRVAAANEDLPGELEALGQLIAILRRQEKIDLSLTYFQRVVEIANLLQDAARSSNALLEMGAIYRVLGNLDNARVCFQEAIAAARSADDNAVVAHANYMLGIACHDEGDFRQALEYCKHARGLSQELGDADLTLQIDNLIGVIHYGYGEFHHAQRILQKCERTARSLKSRRSLALVLVYLSAVECELGNYRHATELAHEALDLGKSLKLPNIASSAQLQLAYISLCSEDYVSAARKFLDALSISERAGDVLERCRAVTGLSAVYYLEGITDMCVGCALRAEELGGSILAYSGTVLYARAHRAAATARAGGFDAAKELLLLCLRDAQKQNSLPTQITVKRLYGEVLMRYGPSDEERDRGRRVVESALTQAADCDLAHEVRRLKALLRADSGDTKDTPTARYSDAAD